MTLVSERRDNTLREKMILSIFLLLLVSNVVLAIEESQTIGDVPNITDTPRMTKKIALTFDDGPNREYTPGILRTLAKYDIKATFFVVGWRVYNFKDLILLMKQNGHEIGNHSYDHPYLNTLESKEIKEQLSMTNTAVKKVAGVDVLTYRPPYASYNDTVLAIGRELGMELVLWTINPEDWRSPGKDKILNRVLEKAQDKSIVLLHDKLQTLEMLPLLIEKLQEEGFEFVTVSEILGLLS